MSLDFCKSRVLSMLSPCTGCFPSERELRAKKDSWFCVHDEQTICASCLPQQGRLQVPGVRRVRMFERVHARSQL